MKYYLLRTVSDPKIKGVKTGLGQVELDKNNPITEKLLNFFSGLTYWEKGKTVPDFEVKNCTAFVYKGAKLTDFLDFSPDLMTCPFMLSERVVEVFDKFNIQPYYTYPVTLYKKDKGLDEKYYLFCCPLLGYEVIDFSKSIFYTSNSLFDKDRTYVHYEKFEDFTKNYNVGIKLEKLVFNSNFNASLDFFKARIGGIHISLALKEAIEIIGFTGISIFENIGPQIVINH